MYNWVYVTGFPLLNLTVDSDGGVFVSQVGLPPAMYFLPRSAAYADAWCDMADCMPQATSRRLEQALAMPSHHRLHPPSFQIICS